MKLGNELKKSWRKHRRLYLSIMAVTVFFPILLISVVSDQQVRLFSLASEPTPLRIWIEPASIIASKNQSFSVSIVGEYEGKGMIIPQVKATLVGSGLTINPGEVEYKQAFTGRVNLGTVKVRAGQAGNYKIGVAENSVFTSLPDLQVVTGSSQVIIK